ncbi:TPA: hypothetical protein PAP86_004426 [Salmonella enterica]|nr:hypothetical protein [Salmonella enterica]
MCFVEPPPAAAATKHPGQGKAPTPRSRGGIIPDHELTRYVQTRFFDAGQVLAWSEAENAPETRSGGFTSWSYISMLLRENITVRILNIFLMVSGIFKICFAAITVWKNI